MSAPAHAPSDVADARRHAVALTAGIFVVAYGTNVSTPFLVVYKERQGLSQSATMAIFVVYVLGILGTLLIAGPLSDRFGRRPIVVPMVALSALASLVMIAGRDELRWLLLGRFLLGVVSGGVLGVGAAWLLELLGPGHEQRAAMATVIMTFAGFGVGPPVSALFDWLVPAPLVVPYLVHAAITFVVVVALLRVPETRPARPRAVRVSLGVPVESRRTFLIVIVPAAIWVFAFPSTSFALFPVLVSDSVSAGKVAIAAGAGALTAWSGLITRPLVGRIGMRPALPVGMVMGVAGYAAGATAFASDSWPLVLVAAPLLGAASGTISVGCLSLIGVMAGDDRRGALTSSFYLLAYPGMAMPLFVTSLGTVVSTSTALVGITSVAALCTVGVVAASRSAAMPATN
ncbi:MAG: MFS transporter [Ilumatobacter sp.]|nr:MFS transporter [Ilumatobacter sp.]